MTKTKLVFILVCLLLLSACSDVGVSGDNSPEDASFPDASSGIIPDVTGNTVTIGGIKYSLSEQSFYDGGVSVKLPEEFPLMSEESAKKKYYTENLADYIFANENGSIAFTFDALDFKMRADEVLYSALGFRSVIHKMSYKTDFLSLDTFPLGCTELGYFDYITPTADDRDAYSIFYTTPFDGKILFGTFTCPAEEHDEWKPVILDILKTISTGDSQAEPQRGALTDFWPAVGDTDGNYEFRVLNGKVSVALPVDEKQPQNLFPVCDVPVNLGAVIYTRNPYILEVPEDEDEDKDDDSKDDNVEAPESVLGNSPALFLPRNVTVGKGDNLWNIAQKEYGDGLRYARIYENNRNTIGNSPGLIYPGQVLELPPLLNTEISIADEAYKFERREFYGGKISMVVPTDFADMPEYFARIKYLHYNSDTEDMIVRVSNEDVNICFVFEIDDEPFSSEEVYSYMLGVKENWERQRPSYKLSEPDVITLEDGVTLGYLDYITPALDVDIFNVCFVMPIEGTGFMGWFSCGADISEDWKLYAHEAIRTIRYEGKDNPPSQNDADYYNRALKYYNSDRNAAALTEIDKAILLNPDKAVYYRVRGDVYLKLGAPREAIFNLDRAIELDPSDHSAYFSRGLISTDTDGHHVAIEYFDKAIELNPSDSLYYYNRARSYWKLMEYEQALEDWNIAIGIKPDSMYIQARGVAYEALGRYEEAIAEYNRAVSISPDNADHFYQRGNYYEDRGMYGRAILDYNRAIELNPAVNYACQHNRALAYHRLKIYDKAVEDYTEALKYSNKDPNTYHNRGTVYLDMKKYDEAIADFTTAICIGADNPHYYDYYRSRSTAYEKNGEQEKSKLGAAESRETSE